MAPHKLRIRIGLLVTSAVAVALCPLTTAALFSARPASARQPFSTVQPVQPTFTPPVGTTAPIPTPLPTLGPGQGFDSTTKPETITEVGDDEFGYGEIADKPGLYLVWITDENGTHYYTMDGSDPQFRGSTRDDDFSDLIDARAETLRELGDKQDEIEKHQTQRTTYDVVALGIIGIGALVCGVITGGLCFAPFAVGALTAVGNAAAQNGAAQSLQPTLDELQGDLDQDEANLRGRFGALSTGP
jgi:hypothetical protein